MVSAENIKGSDKLLKLEVDIGEKRQIVAGIAKSHATADLIGRHVVVMANISQQSSLAWNRVEWCLPLMERRLYCLCRLKKSGKGRE